MAMNCLTCYNNTNKHQVEQKQEIIKFRIAKLNFFLKKRRMRISSARIFSKSFGGKIEHDQTDVDKETTFTKKKLTRTNLS